MHESVYLLTSAFTLAERGPPAEIALQASWPFGSNYKDTIIASEHTIGKSCKIGKAIPLVLSIHLHQITSYTPTDLSLDVQHMTQFCELAINHMSSG